MLNQLWLRREPPSEHDDACQPRGKLPFRNLAGEGTAGTGSDQRTIGF